MPGPDKDKCQNCTCGDSCKCTASSCTDNCDCKSSGQCK